MPEMEKIISELARCGVFRCREKQLAGCYPTDKGYREVAIVL